MGRCVSIGVSLNDRVLPLVTGEVAVDGYELSFQHDTPSRLFWRAINEGAFDVAEMSLAAHCILTARGETPFVGLPVFTSRMFRHGSIFVSDSSKITKPEQLAGKRIGIPEYQMTAAVWMRSILSSQYGVTPHSVHWYTGGVNQPGRAERLELPDLPGVRVTAIGQQATLDGMLIDGEIDAIIAPQIPDSFTAGCNGIRRLFRHPRVVEEAYFKATGIFPIMHLMVVRRSTGEADPDLPLAVYDAFCRAKVCTLSRLADADAASVMLPWVVDEVEAARQLMGADYWPYGVSANRLVLDAFVTELRWQSLIDAPLSLADLFDGRLLDT